MVSEKTRGRRASNQRLLSNARRMRREPTDAERRFWFAVRAHRFGGCKFKRQYPIGPYIADFVCLERRLIVELDGGQHAQHVEYDAERTAYLQARGFRVLRYWNEEFLRNQMDVLEGIWRALNSSSPASSARDLSPKSGERRRTKSRARPPSLLPAANSSLPNSSGNYGCLAHLRRAVLLR